MERAPHQCKLATKTVVAAVLAATISTATMPASAVQQLSEDLLSSVLEYLLVEEMVSCCRVCHEWRVSAVFTAGYLQRLGRLDGTNGSTYLKPPVRTAGRVVNLRVSADLVNSTTSSLSSSSLSLSKPFSFISSSSSSSLIVFTSAMHKVKPRKNVQHTSNREHGKHRPRSSQASLRPNRLTDRPHNSKQQQQRNSIKSMSQQLVPPSPSSKINASLPIPLPWRLTHTEHNRHRSTEKSNRQTSKIKSKSCRRVPLSQMSMNGIPPLFPGSTITLSDTQNGSEDESEKHPADIQRKKSNHRMMGSSRVIKVFATQKMKPSTPPKDSKSYFDGRAAAFKRGGRGKARCQNRQIKGRKKSSGTRLPASEIHCKDVKMLNQVGRPYACIDAKTKGLSTLAKVLGPQLLRKFCESHKPKELLKRAPRSRRSSGGKNRTLTFSRVPRF